MVLRSPAGTVLAGVGDALAEAAHVGRVGRAGGRPVVDGEAPEAAGDEPVARLGEPVGRRVVRRRGRVGEEDGRAEAEDRAAVAGGPRDRGHLVGDGPAAADGRGERLAALGEHPLVPHRRDSAAVAERVSEPL